jgi:IS5 family transposase
MSISIITREANNGSRPPIISELEALFNVLPDGELLAELQGPRRRGRPGYDPKILWRCYVVYVRLNLPSVASLIRALEDNPHIATACGIAGLKEIPHKSTFSRFHTKLAWPMFAVMVRNVQRVLTRLMYERFPDFGRSVAIDATDIKAWSNGGKKGWNGKPSDTDAGWCVKTNTDGNKKYVWGYKVHILADTEYEMPLVVDISEGNLHDVKKASALLRQARYTFSGFHPRYVIADAGYSSDSLRDVIRRQYRALPIIDPNPSHKRATAKTIKTPEWKTIYKSRTAVERLNGRLKEFYKLNNVRVRGKRKVMIHALLSVLVCQARALAFPNQLRHCVRTAAGSVV